MASNMSRPFRYTFILIVVALAVGLAAAGGWRLLAHRRPLSGPIVAISDRHVARRSIACAWLQAGQDAGHRCTRARTASLFERAYSHAPQTLPAHTALLLGPPAVRNRRPRQHRLHRSAATFACCRQMLRDRGFATGGVVSSFVLRKETASPRASISLTATCRPPRLTCRLARCQARRNGVRGHRGKMARHHRDRPRVSFSISTSRHKPIRAA